MSTAEQSYKFTGLFECELLVELMLRYWQHPLAHDREYRQSLLESATEALLSSIDGIILHPGLKPGDMNLVAAIWYAEWSTLQPEFERPTLETVERQNWLTKVEMSLPFCFRNQADII